MSNKYDDDFESESSGFSSIPSKAAAAKPSAQAKPLPAAGAPPSALPAAQPGIVAHSAQQAPPQQRAPPNVAPSAVVPTAVQQPVGAPPGVGPGHYGQPQPSGAVPSASAGLPSALPQPSASAVSLSTLPRQGVVQSATPTGGVTPSALVRPAGAVPSAAVPSVLPAPSVGAGTVPPSALHGATAPAALPQQNTMTYSTPAPMPHHVAGAGAHTQLPAPSAQPQSVGGVASYMAPQPTAATGVVPSGGAVAGSPPAPQGNELGSSALQQPSGAPANTLQQPVTGIASGGSVVAHQPPEHVGAGPVSAGQEVKPAAAPEEIVFGGTRLGKPTRFAHHDPTQKNAAALKKKLRDRDQRTVEHAKLQLLRKSVLGQSNVPERQLQIVPAPQQPMPVETTTPDVATSTYDEKYGLIIPLTNICAAAYAQPADKLREFVEKEVAKTGCSVYDLVNSVGYVPYQYRMLGIKKKGASFTLGFGSKATPLHFACLAARADSVLYLLSCGASPDVSAGIPPAKEIAAANEYKGIVELIAAFVKKNTKRRPKPKPAAVGDPAI